MLAFLNKFIQLWNNKSKIVYGPMNYKQGWTNSLNNMTSDQQDKALNHVQFKTLGISAGYTNII